jgi:hypothetical protein
LRSETVDESAHPAQVAQALFTNGSSKPHARAEGYRRKVTRQADQGGQAKGVVAYAGTPDTIPRALRGTDGVAGEDAIHVSAYEERWLAEVPDATEDIPGGVDLDIVQSAPGELASDEFGPVVLVEGWAGYSLDRQGKGHEFLSVHDSGLPDVLAECV